MKGCIFCAYTSYLKIKITKTQGRLIWKNVTVGRRRGEVPAHKVVLRNMYVNNILRHVGETNFNRSLFTTEYLYSFTPNYLSSDL